jgi:hypothetical protein
VGVTILTERVRLSVSRGVAVQNVLVRQRFAWPFFKPTRPHFTFAAKGSRRKRKLLGLMGAQSYSRAILIRKFMLCFSFMPMEKQSITFQT